MTIIERVEIVEDANHDEEQGGQCESTEAAKSPQVASLDNSTSYKDLEGQSSITPAGHIETVELGVVATGTDNENEDGDQEEVEDGEDVDDPITIHWKKSPFSVGRVKINWSDEIEGSICGEKHDHYDDDGVLREKSNLHIQISGLCCGRILHAGRIGNMAVLLQYDKKNDNLPPRLLWVAGPFWFVTVFITIPLIVGVSMLVYFQFLPGHRDYIRIIWLVATALLLISLIGVSGTDPGILPRHTEPKEENWTWNDQARTFRPPTARYDPLTAVVVRDFDHVCPWTGTAIGRGNMAWFKRFVSMVGICLLLNVIIMTF